MKNGKKILILAVALSVLCALMCVNAFAAEEPTISTIDKADGVNNVTFTINEGAVNFDMTYTGAQDGMFLVLVLGDGTPTDNDGNFAPKAEHILYVNQTTSSGGTVSFTDEGDNVIYPSGIEDQSMVCLAGAGLDKITLLGVITANQVEPDALKGDVTLNNVVDMEDVVALMRHVLKAETITNSASLAVSEVTNNSELDMEDVIKIMQYALKAIGSLD